MNKRNKLASRIAYYCELTASELMDKCSYYTLSEAGGYLGVILRPGSKILAVAHVDFLGTGKVHKANRKVVQSSALDDRLGVYAAIEHLPNMGVPCDVLLCDDEESANTSMQSVGMGFLGRYNWIIELDCSGVRAVTYGYKSMAGVLSTVWDDVTSGSFTDITSVEHVCPVGAFNAGVGYKHQHSESCYVSLKEFRRAMARVLEFYNKYHNVRFDEPHPELPNNVVCENEASYFSCGRYDDDERVRVSALDYKMSRYDGSLANSYTYVEDMYDNDVFLRGDQSPRDGHRELECCEMCNKILLNDEVFLYQGWPVCEEHYYELTWGEQHTAARVDQINADAWED